AARLVVHGALRIYTPLAVDLQNQAEGVMRAHITRIQGGDPNAAPNTSEGNPCIAAQYLLAPKFKLNTPRPVSNAASIVLKPATGEVLAMVGSLDYWNAAIDGNFNAALGLRQPGSAFKPIVYVTAFASSRYTPATMVLDIP